MRTIIIAVIASVALAAEGDRPNNFKITLKKKDDTVEVRADKDKTMFEVRSPFGISQAVIERQVETWPKVVVLRLHLKGMESFRVTNGKIKLDAAVRAQKGQAMVRQWRDGKENVPLDAKSRYWMAIRIVDGAGQPAKTFPLRAGYIEVTLPTALFESNPKTITVNWIDFYR